MLTPLLPEASRCIAMISLLVLPHLDLAAQDRYAFVVGVEDYSPTELRALQYAEDDAKALASRLRALDFQVVLMTGEESNPQLKPSNSAKILAALEGLLKGLQKDDVLLVAMSGHGVQFKDEQALSTGARETYFCPEDAVLSDKSSMLPLTQEVLVRIHRCAAERKLVLIDACRHEVEPKAGSYGPKLINIRSVHDHPRTLPRGMSVLFSCSPTEKAWEHDELKHSVFTNYVLQYLDGKAAQQLYDEGIPSIDGLVAFVRMKTNEFVVKRVRSTGQLPDFVGDGQSWRISASQVVNTISLITDANVLISDPYYKAAMQHLTGSSGDYNLVKAKLAFQTAADQGHLFAKVWMDRNTAKGIFGDEPNRQEALTSYHTRLPQVQQLAEDGVADAQYLLAKMQEDAVLNSADSETIELWMQRAAEQGFLLSLRHLGSSSSQRDQHDAAYSWFEKAAHQGDAPSQARLGTLLLRRQGIAGDAEAAAEWLESAAIKGYRPAQKAIAQMYHKGIGVKKDLEKASAWYLSAARQNDVDSQLMIGAFYAQGLGIPKNPEAANEWVLQAAKGGHPKAQLLTGEAYEYGRGFVQSDSTALRWYRLAGEQGDVRAQVRAGILSAAGRGTSKDLSEAFYWFRKAADQGDDVAQFMVAEQYSKGMGTEEDPKEAVKWYRRAAEQGNSDAQFQYGLHLTLGRGIEQDKDQAVAWLAKSAKQGHADAQFVLGDSYRHAQGVAKDLEKARLWYKKAAMQGHEKAKQELDGIDAFKNLMSHLNDLETKIETRKNN